MSRATVKLFECGHYDLVSIDAFAKRFHLKSTGICGVKGNEYIKVTCPDGDWSWSEQFHFTPPHTYRLFIMTRHPEHFSALIEKLKVKYSNIYPKYENPPPTTKTTSQWPLICSPLIVDESVLKINVRSDEWSRFNKIIQEELTGLVGRLPDMELYRNFDHFKKRVIGMTLEDAEKLAEKYSFKVVVAFGKPYEYRSSSDRITVSIDTGIVTNVVYS